jgi:hypothetical protein
VFLGEIISGVLRQALTGAALIRKVVVIISPGKGPIELLINNRRFL